jgi:hypothetical protein
MWIAIPDLTSLFSQDLTNPAQGNKQVLNKQA